MEQPELTVQMIKEAVAQLKRNAVNKDIVGYMHPDDAQYAYELGLAPLSLLEPVDMIECE